MVLSGVHVAITKGSETEAREAIQKLTGTDAAEGFLMLGQYLRKIRRYIHAAQTLEEAERTTPGRGSEDLFVEMSDLALQVRNSAEALSAAQRSLALHAKSRPLLIRRAHAFLQNDQVEQGRADLRTATCWESWSSSEETAISSAIATLLSKDSELAHQTLGEILAGHPQSGTLTHHYGTVLLRLGRHEAAIEAFRKAIDLLPDGGTRQASIDGLQKALAASGLPPEPIAPKSLANPSISTRPFLMAALTNVYNETFNLPIWLNYYGRQVGIENCIILDNGSDDGSTDNLGGANRVPMPRREKYNEAHSMQMVNNMANNPLNCYDAVTYSGRDEIVVADPAKHANLTEYAATLTTRGVYSIGPKLRQDVTREGPVDMGRPILCQRSLAKFASATCKPLIHRKPVSWTGGLHGCDLAPVFGDAYLFHLRHIDLGQALDRLSTTRIIEFAWEGGGKHHRRDDFDLESKHFCTTHATAVDDSFDLLHLMQQHVAGMEFMPSGRYQIIKLASSNKLFRIPERFRLAF
jgi:tetratricopeptide (TPR) repeat protein